MDTRDVLLVLNALPGIGAVTGRRLYTFFNPLYKVFESSRETLLTCGFLKEAQITSLLHARPQRILAEEKKLIGDYGVQVITLADDAYPCALREIYAPPLVLYCRGAIRCTPLHIAIVGSRYATSYGIHMAYQLAGDCALRGIPVVSGLAKGIDEAAHRGTLDAGGLTYAVIGAGLAHVYPHSNRKLAEQIAASGGCYMSEYPMRYPIKSANFPLRNRIIVGLSQAVVVVEAALRSGALITARIAADEGRMVCAVPGQAQSPFSLGTNTLIQEGARLVISIQDILEECGIDTTGMSNSYQQPLNTVEKKIYDILSEKRLHIDEIMRQVDADLSAVLLNVLTLEMKKYIKQYPGNFFERIESVNAVCVRDRL